MKHAGEKKLFLVSESGRWNEEKTLCLFGKNNMLLFLKTNASNIFNITKVCAILNCLDTSYIKLALGLYEKKKHIYGEKHTFTKSHMHGWI